MDYSALARSYNTLSYTNQLRGLLAAFFQTDKYKELTKYELAKTVNDVVFKHYDGEQILKYKLAKEFRNKKYVAAFEVKAKSSRTDFLVINGDTKSFEVKSKIDTLNRLNKQVSDYGDVFEFNTVVIDKVHLSNVIEIIPEYYGIWYFEGSKKIIYRTAEYSPKINATEQLGIFNKKELRLSFGSVDKDEILASNDSAKINQKLKEMLKNRYFDRWSFVQSNWDKILPIDLQFFFNTNVKPEIIYGV
ncbi:sce7726 family protein [uncultured Chitinophaga sp.]|jgi:hypothetical protein|uniref:sce7726 family protein n=1 Tax=uncultured Chitinophaga sp. TaxID=339340 RepID=UPI0026057A93|nr:sce7726 family protein [uncultured Chitinophaga sp.]